MITAAGGTAIAVRVDHTDESQVETLFARVQREDGAVLESRPLVPGRGLAPGGRVAPHHGEACRAAHDQKATRPYRRSHQRRFSRERQRQHQARSLQGRAEIARDELRRGVALARHCLGRHYAGVFTIGDDAPAFRRDGDDVAQRGKEGSPLPPVGVATLRWELARDYGFTDADGSRPDSGAHFASVVVPGMPGMRDGVERHLRQLERHVRRVKRYLGDADADAGRHSIDARATAGVT